MAELRRMLGRLDEPIGRRVLRYPVFGVTLVFYPNDEGMAWRSWAHTLRAIIHFSRHYDSVALLFSVLESDYSIGYGFWAHNN